MRDELGIGAVTARILASRGLIEPAAVKRFLQPRLADLPHPHQMAGAAAAASRIADALERGEKIGVHGDYDADGITATALLTDFFTRLGQSIETYIPRRLDQGYGFGPDSARELADRGVKLLITVDCGANDHDAVQAANERGLAVIVSDHHEIAGPLPPAAVVINPHRPECGFHAEHLSGVGIAFFLAAAVRLELAGRGWAAADDYDLKRVLDLVALGTVADIVPLVGVNRILVFHGLDLINQDRRPGLAALRKVAAVLTSVRCGDIGYRLVLRINVVGRLGDAAVGLNLLLTADEAEAGRLARLLHEENARRQSIEIAIFLQAQKMFGQISRAERLQSIVLAHPDWHPGVIGIVASRMVEMFNRPTILISALGDVGRGSGRSLPGFNLYEALQACAEHLEGFGGHEQAAGVQIKLDKVFEFAKAFDQYARRALRAEDLVPKQRVDAWCEIDEVTETLVRELGSLAPFGFGNPEPVLAARDVRILNKQLVGGEHLKLRIPWRKTALAVIAFGRAELLDQIGSRLDLAYSPEFNYYGGVEHIQLRARDIVIPDL